MYNDLTNQKTTEEMKMDTFDCYCGHSFEKHLHIYEYGGDDLFSCPKCETSYMVVDDDDEEE